MGRITRSLLVAAFAVALLACGGEHRFSSQELARIMPKAGDAPPSTTIRAELSGPQTLEEFVEAMDVRTKLRSLGFTVAYTASFSTTAFPDDPLEAPLGAALYATFAVPLRDETAAHEGFVFYEGRSKARAKDPTPVLTTGFGKDSVAFHFSRLEDTALPGIAYLWRVGNVLFSVVGVGVPGPDPPATRTLARLMDSRAKR